MTVKKKVALLVFSLVVAQGVYYTYKTADAAIPVIDTANINQTNLTYLQALQTAVNTATQIANQVKELASLSPEALMANVSGINTQLGEIKNVMSSATGLMHSAQSAEEAWQSTFGTIENYGNATSASRAAQQSNMLYYLDKTYQDGLRSAKLNSQIEKDFENLNKSLDQAANAEGNKQLGQANAAIAAQSVKQQIQLNQSLSALNATLAAKANYERSIDNMTFVDSQKTVESINANVSDTNPLSSRRKGLF